MEKVKNVFENILKILEISDKDAEENANALFKQFGNSETYKLLRVEQYKKATHLLYSGYKYKIISVGLKREDIVIVKRLGFKIKRKPFSGRLEPKKEIFSITSDFDKQAILYRLINGKTVEAIS